jgi:phospholipid/cholesterol/gamma-HCH transport system substrate-binding protein
VKRFRNELGVGVLILAALSALLYLSFKVGALKSLGDTITIEAVFDDASGLVEDGDVRLVGVRIGGIKSLEVHDGKCLATLVIKRDAGLRKDVRAEIRARSVLGEKYVAMQPQGESAPALDSGDRIVDTKIPYEIDQMVTAIAPMLEAIDPDDIAVIVSAMASVVRDTGDADTAGLIAKAETLLDNLNEMASVAPQVKQDVPVIMSNLRTTSERLPRTLNRLDQTLDRADVLVARLDESTEGLPETMEDFEAAAEDLRELAAILSAEGEELGPILDDLAVIMENFSVFDREEIIRILREEGVRVRTGPPKK